MFSGASECLLLLAESMRKCLSPRTGAEDGDFLPHLRFVITGISCLVLYSACCHSEVMLGSQR